MADWDEIKRLAADFQKVQLSSTSQKLSERNCIEIISYLKEKKLIELISSVDGKELLTPAHLVQEVLNELYVSGGRVNLVELSKSLGVDYAHINAHLKDILKGQSDVHWILGQLIDGNYITKLAGEINEKLSQQGQINVSDLTIQYDLPAEFLQQYILERNLGKIIQGKQDASDPRVFFTESFVARCKAKIRGALAGLTRPTSVSTIFNQTGVAEKLFFSLFDQCSPHGTLTSRSVGALYIPNVYARSQNEWVNNFYRQNYYLEYDALTRLGITDYKTYVKKQLASEQLIFLNSCVVSKRILERAEADLDECISSKTYLDLGSTLPSVFNENDLQTIIETVLTKQKQAQTILIGDYIISNAYIDELTKNFDELLSTKAKDAVDSGIYQQYQTELHLKTAAKTANEPEFDEKSDRKEERRKKAAGGKTGGGTQGRETKTKSTKKAQRARVDSTGDSAVKKELSLVTLDDVITVIEPLLDDEGLADLTGPIGDYLRPKLNERALAEASRVYASTVADRSATRRQTHNETENKLNALIGDVRLFKKGIKTIPNDADITLKLEKYLMKTLCTDIVTEILNYLAVELNLNAKTEGFAQQEQRLKFVGELPQEYRKSTLALAKSVTGPDVDDFLQCVEEAMISCNMFPKKVDRKKDKLVVLNHKHSLLEQLNKCEDLSLVLHLAVLVIFTVATQCMLHASGKHVMAILKFLRQYLSDEEYNELVSYHDFVTLMLSGGTEAESAKEKLKEKMNMIKTIANDFKKSASTDKS